MSADSEPRFRLTRLIGRPMVAPGGDVLGRIDDLIVRLNGAEHPPLTGLRAKIGSRQVFVPIQNVVHLSPERIELIAGTVNLGQFTRREGEVLLRTDILGHKVIHLEAGRLRRASDVELAYSGGSWRVVGVDTSVRNLLDRIVRRRTSDPVTVLDWSRVEPFVGHVPTSKLRLPLPRLRRLHPAQIADLVEEASHEEGEEIIAAVHDDPELEADVFEELDSDHQIEFLRDKSDVEAAEVLASMEPDDAADLIADLDQSRRASILARLPAEQQARVRSLLAYHPDTAGGLMTPDFLSVHEDDTVQHIVDRLKEDITLPSVYVVDQDNRLTGVIPVARLLWAERDSKASACLESVAGALPVHADFAQVALVMADYNLTAAPVVNEEDRLVGVVSVDDVLEAMIPADWRRRAEGDLD